MCRSALGLLPHKAAEGGITGRDSGAPKASPGCLPDRPGLQPMPGPQPGGPPRCAEPPPQALASFAGPASAQVGCAQIFQSFSWKKLFLAFHPEVGENGPGSEKSWCCPSGAGATGLPRAVEASMCLLGVRTQTCLFDPAVKPASGISSTLEQGWTFRPFESMACQPPTVKTGSRVPFNLRVPTWMGAHDMKSLITISMYRNGSSV